jgi:hypothetical protein
VVGFICPDEGGQEKKKRRTGPHPVCAVSSSHAHVRATMRRATGPSRAFIIIFYYYYYYYYYYNYYYPSVICLVYSVHADTSSTPIGTTDDVTRVYDNHTRCIIL